MALPLLEAMAPNRMLDASLAAGSTPRRMLFVYIPNGVCMEDWTPTKTGTDYELPKTLKPLAPFKDEILVLSGLDLDTARQRYKVRGCQHGPPQSSFLTCAIPLREKVQVGISVDQLAAQSYGKTTKFPSLELGTEIAVESHCNGYPCTYFQGISWKGPASPCLMEINPRLVFERVFANGHGGEGSASRALRDQQRKSILDLVAEDSLQLRAQLGMTDQRKLDEYFNGIREVELRVSRFEKQAPLQITDAALPPDQARALREVSERVTNYQGEIKKVALERRGGEFSVGYGDLESHVKIISDLLVLAFQMDVTRIATFMFGREGSQRSYPFLGIKGDHHGISHHGNRKEKIDQLRVIDRYHVTLFAYLLEKMKAVKERDSTLLDNSMVVYGGAISDGNQHRYGN
ncbi:MAG: DUF1552 domain-containing protein, partial [Acidobacteria bacterium]|nr:DUF1552 domain-containing protein [Acidobacteriota bacterium]